MFAYREKTKVKMSKADITFLGKAQRENVKLTDVPVFITPKDEQNFFPEVIIGVRGIFDKFEIKFDLGQNRIKKNRFS